MTQPRPARRWRGRALIALATAAALVPGLTASASAERWAGPDASGDVSGEVYDPEPAPCGTFTPVDASAMTDVDLTGLSVRHQRRVVTVELGVTDLHTTGDVSLTVHLRTANGAWAVDLDRWGKRTGFSSFLYEEPDWDTLVEEADPDGDGCWTLGVVLVEQHCQGLERHSDADADTVQLTIPRTCLGRPRWVRVAAEGASWRDSDDAIFSDRWAPDGVEPTTFVGPFGPRVHAGPVLVPVDGAGGTPRRETRAEATRHVTMAGTPAGVVAIPPRQP